MDKFRKPVRNTSGRYVTTTLQDISNTKSNA
jgi:hypothetical protein